MGRVPPRSGSLVRVIGTCSACRPNSATYLEYGFLGTLAVLALCTATLWATPNAAAPLVVGIVSGALCVWRLTRTGMTREPEELVVVNLIRTYRVPFRSIRGYRIPLVSFSLGKQSGVTLILTSGDRVNARMVDVDAGGWLEAQGVGKVDGKDACPPRRT
jgi:hypothetical protein